MRATARDNGISVKAYAGTTGVLLAFDVRKRAGLLGFAIEREGGNRPREWLMNMLEFQGVDPTAEGSSPTSLAPIQRFRWSDYRVYPGISYTYYVYPVYGTSAKPALGDGTTITVTTPSATNGEHRVLFNRAAAASQAFARDFPEVDELIEATPKGELDKIQLPARALAWLSRGALEQITGICAKAADPTWALDVAIYEFELPAIVEALNAARERGAEVRIVYHAKPRDKQTEHNEREVRGWPPETVRPRVTSKICHDKFIVLSRIEGERRTPRAVLCGSTNFTENGVYRQANVIHVVERGDVARQYLDLFEVLFGGATPAETKAWIDANNPLSTDAPFVVGFSPRSDEVDLDLFADEIRSAQRDVLFCTAFNLNERIDAALLGKPRDDILRLGLQNTRTEITGYHRDRTADFTATAMLPKGIEGFLEESTKAQRGNILIHTKLVVVDFTSRSPTVISGSHNLSAAASAGNDENYLIVRGNADIADCYGVELMRLYDHYRFRWHVKEGHKRGGAARKPRRAPGLAPDDSWTDAYFTDGTLEQADRLRFGVRAS